VKLTELDPRWLEKEGRRIGFTFLCPCCLKDRLTALGEATSFKEQVQIMHKAMNTTPEDECDWPINWVPSRSDYAWQLSNLNDFNTISVNPSIDASTSGNWHGYITNGEIC
jgi:hypothetical protein